MPTGRGKSYNPDKDPMAGPESEIIRLLQTTVICATIVLVTWIVWG